MINSELVSVIMSTYNDENTISAAIESILSQTYKNIEIHINDDGSKDNTMKIIEGYSKQNKNMFIYRNNKNIGLTKSLNFLINKTKGEYIARQDADDSSHPDRINQQIITMKKNNLDFCGTRAIVKQTGKIIPNYSYYLPKNLLIKYKNPFIHGTLVFKKEVIVDIGGYDENFYYSQDYKLIVKLFQENHTFKMLRKPYYSLNYSNNISINFKAEQKYYADCARKGINPDY
ncbi:glycosyltransferase family 2 protein [Acidimicrobiia bacterium]|mgnify:CR=1 FL=1|nr:glycosyltransferase family 2 protein [Acidimicrobiia bacterium]